MQVSSADNALGFSALGASGVAVSSNVGPNITTSGFTASAVNANVYSIYPGAGYNLSSMRDGSTRGVSVEINNLSVRDQVVINNDGSQVESFNRVELSPSSAQSIEFLLNVNEENNESEYIFVEIEDTSENAYTPVNDFEAKANTIGVVGNGTSTPLGTPRFLKIVEGTYSLAGGDSGATTATDLVGTAAAKTGIYALDDDALNV